jgi:drug/metabolite transporter (DMT)-like permease
MVGWQLLIGTVPLAVGWLIAMPPLELPDAAHWLAFAWMVLVGNVLAYLVWFRLVDRLPTVVVGIGSLVVPCIGVLSSALVLGEAVRPADLIALALVCAALGLVLFLPRRAATSA